MVLDQLWHLVRYRRIRLNTNVFSFTFVGLSIFFCMATSAERPRPAHHWMQTLHLQPSLPLQHWRWPRMLLWALTPQTPPQTLPPQTIRKMTATMSGSPLPTSQLQLSTAMRLRLQEPHPSKSPRLSFLAPQSYLCVHTLRETSGRWVRHYPGGMSLEWSA